MFVTIIVLCIRKILIKDMRLEELCKNDFLVSMKDFLKCNLGVIVIQILIIWIMRHFGFIELMWGLIGGLITFIILNFHQYYVNCKRWQIVIPLIEQNIITFSAFLITFLQFHRFPLSIGRKNLLVEDVFEMESLDSLDRCDRLIKMLETFRGNYLRDDKFLKDCSVDLNAYSK